MEKSRQISYALANTEQVYSIGVSKMNKVRTGKKARRSWQRKQFILISKGKPKKISSRRLVS